jgi:hypothetical protein
MIERGKIRMAFRADEAAQDGYEQARSKLVRTQGLDPAQRELADRLLKDLIEEHGPVVQGYPTWHPLVPQFDPHSPVTYPDARSGYKGLDHTVCFAHAFVTCPYNDGEAVIKSVESMKEHSCATVTAKPLGVQLYNSGTTSILVSCKWNDSFTERHMIPKRIAVPLMIREDMRLWLGARVGERWETMCPYLLGVPHGARSSLFVTQDTAMAMKRVYMAMVESGMFGPLRMD